MQGRKSRNPLNRSIEIVKGLALNRMGDLIANAAKRLFSSTRTARFVFLTELTIVSSSNGRIDLRSTTSASIPCSELRILAASRQTRTEGPWAIRDGILPV